MARKASERFVWAVDTLASTQPIACWKSAADTVWPSRWCASG